LCEDASIIGSAFYVMDFVDGRLFWDPALPELDSAERGQVYAEMNRVLAAIHRVDLDATGLRDFGKPGNYYQRQIERWTRQYRAAEMETQPAMERLIEWLPAHLPTDDGWVGLIHGDYRLDNLMFARDRLEIVAVFDWELSTLGHPPADLAYQIMQRAMARDWPIRGLAGLDAEALGIPSTERYVTAYCDRLGIDSIEHWSFYLTFGFFRFASICQGIRQRAAQGNASSFDAGRTGAMAIPLAELGWDVARSAI
jgi:aminoglycoside phosphotransferase (APT) family kinase protein